MIILSVRSVGVPSFPPESLGVGWPWIGGSPACGSVLQPVRCCVWSSLVGWWVGFVPYPSSPTFCLCPPSSSSFFASPFFPSFLLSFFPSFLPPSLLSFLLFLSLPPAGQVRHSSSQEPRNRKRTRSQRHPVGSPKKELSKNYRNKNVN